MRIAFIDVIEWDYTVRTPQERPLGGSQSALCYLTSALARLGHDVFLVNNHPHAEIIDEVYHAPLRSLNEATLRSFQAVVLQNCVTPGVRLRKALGPHIPLILWSQHAHDQPGVSELRDAAARDAFHYFAFVSDWQRQCYIREFSMPGENCVVLRNAVSPPFLQVEPRPIDWTAPRLAYTSTPFRGLNLLVESILPEIRAALPGVQLDIYSSMAVYNMANADDQKRYGQLYELARRTPGINYVGSIPQSQLADELSGTWLLSYPNTFAETSCISVMEALAAGCDVITSDLGALPETLAGLGELVFAGRDRNDYCERYVAAVLAAHAEATRDPKSYATQRAAHVAAGRAAHWSARAKDWAHFLSRILAAPDT